MSVATPLKVHLFKVRPIEGSPALANMLDRIDRLELEARLPSTRVQHVRLEEIARPEAGSALWRLDFCKLRAEGPGRASARERTRGFDMGEDERFSEETAAIYDEQSGYMAIQYNHYGPRATAIEEYLSVFAGQGCGYEFAIQLDPAVQARLAQKTIFSKLAYRVAPARLTSHWREENVSMTRAIRSQQEVFGGEWVTVEVSMSRQRAPSLKLLENLKGLIGLTQESDDAVSRLQVSGKDRSDAPIEKIDLLHGKLVKVFDRLAIGADRRVSQNLRWTCLEDAINDWKASGLVR